MKYFVDSKILKIAGPKEFEVSPASRFVRHTYYSARAAMQRLPETSDALQESPIFKAWWYYTVELLPGLTKEGIYPEDFPLLPRMLLRNCDLGGTTCLDLGSMEGLLPVLMRRQGADKVLATDANYHCYEKIGAIRRYYKVQFDFQQIGSMYDLSSKLRGHGGFDLINLSGVLYHVFSPMHVIAGARPLLKKDGLMILSTNVVNRHDFSMEFNVRGKLQREGNTFWYPSIPLYDYMLRYLRLAPIDCLYLPYSERDSVRYVEGLDAGYLAVVCRATDQAAVEPDDEWAQRSSKGSWEIINSSDIRMLEKQPHSRIRYKAKVDSRFRKADGLSIDLPRAVKEMPPVYRAEKPEDSNWLRLEDAV